MKKILMISLTLLMLLLSVSCAKPEYQTLPITKLTDPDEIPTTEVLSQLSPMTEAELFALGTADFRGTVTAVENYCVDFDGEKHYCAVVTFRVDKALRSNLAEGEEIRVYISSPIGVDVTDTANEIAAKLNVGMEGVFRPWRYGTEDFDGADSGLCINDIWFDKRELAEYGFFDGTRFLFLEGEEGLIYDETAFPNLADAETLEDVEQYVVSNWNWCGEDS